MKPSLVGGVGYDVKDLATPSFLHCCRLVVR